MIETDKAKKYCRLCVSEANSENPNTALDPLDEQLTAQTQLQDASPSYSVNDTDTKSQLLSNIQNELEQKGNSETALTALLTLAGIEG